MKRELEEQGVASQTGMTLRDYFAAKAMQGVIVGMIDYRESDVAACAYALADAMLKERGE